MQFNYKHPSTCLPSTEVPPELKCALPEESCGGSHLMLVMFSDKENPDEILLDEEDDNVLASVPPVAGRYVGVALGVATSVPEFDSEENRWGLTIDVADSAFLNPLTIEDCDVVCAMCYDACLQGLASIGVPGPIEIDFNDVIVNFVADLDSHNDPDPSAIFGAIVQVILGDLELDPEESLLYEGLCAFVQACFEDAELGGIELDPSDNNIAEFTENGLLVDYQNAFEKLRVDFPTLDFTGVPAL